MPNEEPIAKTPADLAKLMEQCQDQNQGGQVFKVDTQPKNAPQSEANAPAAQSKSMPFSLEIKERKEEGRQETSGAGASSKRKSKFRAEMTGGS
mmetsp:Transcript_14735/g.25072  ORF Transcript_14735/g.25072 Transcript_14735/m.25072 type:complete len:94 (+) Transcript_14735:644-925(+)